MAEHYRFFNSAEGDIREYTASEFAEYFSRFLTDGLYAENGKAGLQVMPDIGLNISIDIGYAFVRGYMYKNDAVLIKQLEPADTILDRIDRVVLRFDEVARTINIVTKKGEFSSTPQSPAIEITSTVKEMTLAQVRIRKNATSITAQDITDERFTDTCGLVSSLIDIPVQEMWNVWNSTLDDIEAAWVLKQGDIQNEWDGIKANWQAWFDSVQNDLGVRTMIGATEPVNLQAGDVWWKEL